MMGSSRVIATVLASVLVVGPVATQLAQAQPTPTPTPQQKQQFSELMKQAITKGQAGDHAGAIETYQKAYATMEAPTVLSNIGAEYQLDKKPVEALKYFCMYLDKDPAGPLATFATSQAKLLQAQITGAPVEDSAVCKAPAKPTGTTGTTGPAKPDGGGDDQVTGTKKLETPPPPAADPGKTLKLVGLVTAGVGVAAVGAGVYFGLQAKSISDDISQHTDPTIPWRDDILAYQDKGQRDENLQIGFLIGGGVLVLGGALLYVKGRAKHPAETSISPTASANGGGVSLSGAF